MYPFFSLLEFETDHITHEDFSNKKIDMFEETPLLVCGIDRAKVSCVKSPDIDRLGC